MAMTYSEKVMDHFAHPRNVGTIENADGVGEVGNMVCGDIMKIYLKVEDGIIQDVKFNTFGCGSAIATSSMATEMIKGKPVEDALKLTNQAVVEALDGLPPVKLHCSVPAGAGGVSAEGTRRGSPWPCVSLRCGNREPGGRKQEFGTGKQVLDVKYRLQKTWEPL